jgi:hypothetical protein
LTEGERTKGSHAIYYGNKIGQCLTIRKGMVLATNIVENPFTLANIFASNPVILHMLKGE